MDVDIGWFLSAYRRTGFDDRAVAAFPKVERHVNLVYDYKGLHLSLYNVVPSITSAIFEENSERLACWGGVSHNTPEGAS